MTPCLFRIVFRGRLTEIISVKQHQASDFGTFHATHNLSYKCCMYKPLKEPPKCLWAGYSAKSRPSRLRGLGCPLSSTVLVREATTNNALLRIVPSEFLLKVNAGLPCFCQKHSVIDLVGRAPTPCESLHLPAAAKPAMLKDRQARASPLIYGRCIQP